MMHWEFRVVNLQLAEVYYEDGKLLGYAPPAISQDEVAEAWKEARALPPLTDADFFSDDGAEEVCDGASSLLQVNLLSLMKKGKE